MLFTEGHRELQRTLRNFISREINPHVDEWEKAGLTPLHEVMKKLGDLGLLGIDKPEAYGGLGLDYSYAMAATETLGEVSCGGVKLGIDVQTSMATPALARFDGDELREEFLRPAIAGDAVCSIAVSEVAAGSDSTPSLLPGECTRIFTGANVPPDADAVIPVEMTSTQAFRAGHDDACIEITEAVASGAHIFKRGENAHAGDVLLEAGVQLHPRQVAVCAASG